MRDEAQLSEEPVRDYSPQTVAWTTAVGLLTAAGIFTLGFLIGGRMARLDIAHEPVIDPIARLDVQRKLHDDLTFYDDLTAKQKGHIAEPAQPADAGPAIKPATTAGPNKTPGAVKVAATKTPAKQTPKAAASGAHVAAEAIAESQSGQALDKRSGDAPQYRGLLGLHEGPARTGEYTVQVSSYQSQEEARAFCSTLERKGFRPFVVKTDLGLRGTWYRVRVGRFLDEGKAKEAKQILAQVEIPSWVLRTE